MPGISEGNMHHRSRRHRHAARALLEAPETEVDDPLSRAIADWCVLWLECGRPVCRRAKCCRGEGSPCLEFQEQAVVACIREHAPLLRLVEATVEADEEEAGFA